MKIKLGTKGNDTLTGGTKDDLISGQNGNDLIKGGKGDDILGGDAGKDTLSGGSGSNIFVFSSPSEGIDSILDFSDDDGIVIDKEQFGATSTKQFRYDNRTGKLFFDASTTDKIPSVQFASLPVNLGSAFDPKEDILLAEEVSDSDIITSKGSISNFSNDVFSNINTNGKDFRADPQSINI